MQDNRDGQLKVLKGIDAKKMATNAADDSVDFKTRLKNAMKDPEFVRKVGEQNGIPTHAQGPVFTIDEPVEVKGGMFKVRGFQGGLLHLEGIPGVTMDVPDLKSTYKFKKQGFYVFLTVPDNRNDNSTITHGISLETARRLHEELAAILA